MQGMPGNVSVPSADASEAVSEHQNDENNRAEAHPEESFPFPCAPGSECSDPEGCEDSLEELDESALISQDCSIDLTILKLEGIQEQLDRLEKEFQSKLKYDAHKDRIIDHLHQELQAYKSDVVKKEAHSMIVDVIKIIDDIRKFTKHYRNQAPSAENHARLFKFLESLPSDLEELFEWQGVKPFVCGGNAFDPKRQRITKKIETRKKAEHRTIADSLRPGYEWGGKVIRPEMVAVFLYKEDSVGAELRSLDE